MSALMPWRLELKRLVPARVAGVALRTRRESATCHQVAGLPHGSHFGGFPLGQAPRSVEEEEINMSKEEKFAQQVSDQANPGEFDKQDSVLHNDVTGDNSTNGVSASMIRFGDLDNESYAEKLDQVGNEIKSENEE